MLNTPSPWIGMRESILIFLKSEVLALSVKKAFEANGYRSTTVHTDTDAFSEAKTTSPSLIILDREQGTVHNLRQLRVISAVPIVAVQEHGNPCADDDCVQFYERDVDLVVCSHSLRELVARVRAILRRGHRVTSSTYYSVGNLRMDLDRHEVSVDGHVVDLTPKEFQILRQLIESPGRVFSRQEMLNLVWGEGYALEEHALDVHIHSLRQKIDTGQTSPHAIVTVRGFGYKLRS